MTKPSEQMNIAPEIDKATPREVSDERAHGEVVGMDATEQAHADIVCRLDTLLATNKRLREALQEIEKGEGAFSLDHKQHAINTIENMKSIARVALEEVE